MSKVISDVDHTEYFWARGGWEAKDSARSGLSRKVQLSVTGGYTDWVTVVIDRAGSSATGLRVVD